MFESVGLCQQSLDLRQVLEGGRVELGSGGRTTRHLEMTELGTGIFEDRDPAIGDRGSIHGLTTTGTGGMTGNPGSVPAPG